MQQVLAVFTENGVPKTGLSPTVTIYRLDTSTAVVTDAAMTEILTSGQYLYDFAAWDSSVSYSTICTSSLTGFEKYAYGAITSARVIESSLSTDDILRLLLAKATGIAQGGGGSLINFKSVDTTKDRINMTVDTNGNRSSVVMDPS